MPESMFRYQQTLYSQFLPGIEVYRRARAIPTAAAIRTIIIIVQIVTGLFTLANRRSAALLFLRLVLTEFHSNLIVMIHTVKSILHK